PRHTRPKSAEREVEIGPADQVGSHVPAWSRALDLWQNDLSVMWQPSGADGRGYRTTEARWARRRNGNAGMETTKDTKNTKRKTKKQGRKGRADQPLSS